jgi:hypothetical protein
MVSKLFYSVALVLLAIQGTSAFVLKVPEGLLQKRAVGVSLMIRLTSEVN